MQQIQQELRACREYAEQGYGLAYESFGKMKEALRNEQAKLRETERRQTQIKWLENDRLFKKQLLEIKRLEQQTIDGVGENLRSLKEKMG